MSDKQTVREALEQLPSYNRATPHIRVKEEALQALDNLTDKAALIKTLEGMKRKPRSLSKGLNRPCAINAHNNQKVRNAAIDAAIKAVGGE